MSDNVITPNFGEKPEPRIWTCVCGCQDFELYEDGKTVCPLCGTVGYDGGGHWLEMLKESDAEPPEVTRTSINHGSIELAKKAIMRDANDDDTMLLLIARRNGAVRLWTKSDELTTDEQKRWLRTRFEAAMSLASGAPYISDGDEEHPE